MTGEAFTLTILAAAIGAITLGSIVALLMFAAARQQNRDHIDF